MRKTSLLIFLLTAPLLMAQRNLTIEEATNGSYTRFAPQSISAPKWQSENQLTFLDASYQRLQFRNQTKQWQVETLVDKSELEAALLQNLPEANIKLRIFPYDYTWDSESTLSFIAKAATASYYITYDVVQKQVVQSIKMQGEATEATRNSSANLVAWLDANNIVISKANGSEERVTNDEPLNIVNGSSDTHRQEFGIDKGMWWNPKGDLLMYYSKNQTAVSTYPLVDFSSRVATVKEIKYPMAGMTNETVKLVVYNVQTKAKVELQTGNQIDQFLTMVTWAPDGLSVYVGLLNRGQNHLKVNRYNASTGAFEKTLFEEQSSTYTEPSHALIFNPNNDKEFLYLSEKEGFRQMYLYNTQGKMLKKLGYQDVLVKEVLGFDSKASAVYYVGATQKGMERQLFKVLLNNGKTEAITNTSGTHQVVINPSKTLFLDQFSNITTPNDIKIVTVATQKETVLEQATNPYQGVVDLPQMEMVSLTAADGKTPLNGRIIYPKDFDASKKYPVMIYVYGGPHAQLVQNKWLGGASLFDYYMAQNGYVVFTLDNRGSDNRGRDFEHVIHRNLGQHEMADQLKGVEYLKSKRFVDAEKIGVYGWSFGGFMTTSLSVNHPEIFKVGVAGGPVMDWKFYEIMYGERYMDQPSENAEGYEKTSLLNKANLLDNPLLVIHGAQDPVVVQQHSMEFIEACIKAGKQVDYFLYPSHEHNVMGRDRIHLNQKIADYFFTHLQKSSQQ